MEYWKCTICDIEMQLQSRDSHLSGKRHAAAAEAHQEDIVQARRFQEAQKQLDTQLTGSRHAMVTGLYQENPMYWTCTVCDIRMQTQNRDSHLSGKRHAISTQSQQTGFHVDPGANLLGHNNSALSSLPSTAKAFPANSGVGGIASDTMYAASDLTQVNGAMAIMVWQCMMCNYYMPLSEKQPHLSSLDHIQNLLETIKVTCMAIPQPQIEVYSNDLREKERLDYQEVASGIKKLAVYLMNHSPYQESIPGSSAMNLSSKSVAQPNLNTRSEPHSWSCPDCRTTLAADLKETHSCLYLQSTPVPSTSPVDAFFRSFPGYRYNPSIPLAESFQSFRRGLQKWNNWDGRSPDTWKEYEKDVFTRYQTALTQEFNLWFGTDDDIRSWHSLCRAIKIHPLPTTCKECREVVRNRHVNIVDLIQWAREREVGDVRIFKTVKELSEYSYDEDKIYRKDQIKQGVVLRHLLRRLEEARM